MSTDEKASQRLSKALRITRRNDIQRVFREGRRAVDGCMTLLVVPNGEPGGRSRGGVVVSRRHGNAVRRNRIKRLCREAFRLTRAELPAGYDYMIVPRAGARLALEPLRDSLRNLAARVTSEAGEGAHGP